MPASPGVEKKMKTCKRFTAPLLVAALVVVLATVTQLLSQQGNEAPTGFDTPTLSTNPGGQSKGNGLVDDVTFGNTQAVFEEEDGVDKGLGPIYNARSCAECHQNPVTGGGSQIAEFRLGHRDRNGNFVSPNIAINRGQTVVPNRSLLNDRAICAEAQERAPGTENIRTFRMSLNVLGDGFVEAIDDNTLKAIAAAQPGQSGGHIKGEFIMVPIAEAAGTTRVGRFGWKDQQASLLSFSGDAYVNEQGITSRLNLTDSTQLCKTTTDPEDVDNDIDQFATFMRTTKAPPVDATLLATADAQAGQQIFTKIGCATCHVASITTVPTGTKLNGDTFTVPDALGSKVLTGDGIVQNGPQDTANKMRTAPLWGMRTRDRLMHDGLSTSRTDAIERHNGEGTDARRRFEFLSDQQKNQLITFLNSL
ncbi:MAG: hypothetical protein DMG80_11630 [Acidobacteria bacterium]|nr:MAG: hypothetical protein DMG80_11630 [Acidobacteriota bacterium]